MPFHFNSHFSSAAPSESKCSNCWIHRVCTEVLLLTMKLLGVSMFACKVNVDVLIKQKAHQQPGLNVKNVKR